MNAAVLVSRQHEIMRELARRESKNSLGSFLRAAWPLIEPKHPFIPGRHIDAMAEHLEAVHRGEIRNLLINVPPRHVKSTMVSVAYPAWVWTEEAQHKFIYGSHSHSLAKRDSVKTRNIVTSPWYRETFATEWSLTEDQNEKSNFVNTVGGSRRATSVLSSIIGEGGDTLVLDDPHSPRSVRSDTQRQSELDWIDQEFFTRINDPKTVSKIVIMQRLDQRDASEHLLEKGDWEHLMLPAEFEPERKCFTVIGWEDPRKEPGEPLWPERFDTPELNTMKIDMGSKAWAGQGQQRPSPGEGSIFKRQYLQNFYKEIPNDLDFFALSIDLPFDQGGSYAVFQVWGRRKGDRYLLDQTRAQVGFSEQITMFRTMLGKWPKIMAKWVEKKANGAAMISTLQREFAGLIPVEPTASKEIRAEAVTPQFESGNVFLPDPSIAPWIGDYIEELVAFNNGAFNDQVDATSQALSKMAVMTNFDDMGIGSITGKSKWLR